MAKTRTVDDYIEKSDQWQAALRELRNILLASGLEETVKWGSPCYTHAGKNVVGLAAFKLYFGLWFFQGALLNDPDKVLVNAQSGKTKAMRQWRFGSGKDIDADSVRAYVSEAMANAASGKKIKPQRRKPLAIPAELQSALTGNKQAKSAFDKLTPGKQREYADYIAGAKRSATRAARIEKVLPMITAGKGLNDQYR